MLHIELCGQRPTVCPSINSGEMGKKLMARSEG